MRRGLAGLCVLVLGLAAGAGVALAQNGVFESDRIFPEVYIEGIPVGGRTPAEAAELLWGSAQALLNRTLVLHLATEEVVLTHAELGLRVRGAEAIQEAYQVGRVGPWWARVPARLGWGAATSIPLRSTLDRRVLRRLIIGLAGEIAPEPRDAQVTVEAGAVVIVQPGRPGRTLDVEATVRQIAAAMAAGASDTDAVVTVAEPAFTTADAQELRAPLAEFTTTIAGDANRLHNVTLAASFLRGRLLAPDEVLSYNQTVGPRTVERGFREAPVLIDDELVAGDGGGVCQVSSTLFNVALLADFEVLSRANHSRPVAYLPLGRDATVVYDQLDLRLRNTSGRHVLLWAEVHGRRLTVTAYGTPEAGKAVEVVVTDLQELAPPEGTVTKHDPKLDEGTVVAQDAQPGYRVKTWRVVAVHGTEVRRDFIGRSVYRAVPRTIRIGTRRARQISARN